MNNPQDQPANHDHVINLQITIPQEMLKSIVDQLAPVLAQQIKNALLLPSTSSPLQGERKLAYSVAETANLLGTCSETVYRLIQRGLLRSSGALRIKLITEKEIQRFLSQTTRSEY